MWRVAFWSFVRRNTASLSLSPLDYLSSEDFSRQTACVQASDEHGKPLTAGPFLIRENTWMANYFMLRYVLPAYQLSTWRFLFPFFTLKCLCLRIWARVQCRCSLVMMAGRVFLLLARLPCCPCSPHRAHPEPAGQNQHQKPQIKSRLIILSVVQ